MAPPVALIIVLGVAFIPSLYAWINIYANWDPYGNTGNLRVAVASKDAGYQVEGVSVNMGERVIESLHGDENFDWQFTNEAEARDGVESGKYYAAVIIPASFTEDIVTFITDNTERPAIEYYSNEKKNAIAAKITTTGMGTLRSTINEQFINTVSAVVLDVLNITDSMLEEKEDSIVEHITSSLEKNQPGYRPFFFCSRPADRNRSIRSRADHSGTGTTAGYRHHYPGQFNCFGQPARSDRRFRRHSQRPHRCAAEQHGCRRGQC